MRDTLNSAIEITRTAMTGRIQRINRFMASSSFPWATNELDVSIRPGSLSSSMLFCFSSHARVASADLLQASLE